MTRYNIFYQVHKGLRALLYNTAGLLQQTDFDNPEEAATAMNALTGTIDLFEEHAHTEDSFINAAIAQHEPSISTLFEEEHVQDHLLGNQLQSLINVFNNCSTAAEQIIAGGAIRIAFTEFLVFNLKHMAKEEQLLNEYLWKYYSDDELKNLTQKIVSSIPPDYMQRFSGWMMSGLSNNEITGWLNEVRNNAPEFVFNGMLALAEAKLPAQRLNPVMAQLTEGALLAQ